MTISRASKRNGRTSRQWRRWQIKHFMVRRYRTSIHGFGQWRFKTVGDDGRLERP